MLQTIALIGLLLYFIGLMWIVSKEKRDATLLDYFFAGRTLPFWALSITFIASWWGAGSALSTADLAFDDGLGAFWYYGVPVLIATGLMMLIAGLVRRTNLLTQGQMMAKHYSPAVAKMLSVMILIFMIFTAASQMVGVGLFFGTYLNMDYTVAVLIGTGIVLIYSLFGGFRGVVLTDILQFILLAISAIAVFIVGWQHAGGLTGILAHSKAATDPNYLSFFAGASKYMMYVITFGCAWMIQANVWQRISAARTDRDARQMTVLSFFVYIPLYLIVVLTGIAGSVLYTNLPEGGIVTAIVMDHMHPLIGGLVFVGISAAIMSTMDSLINTGAMTLTIDLYPSSRTDAQKQRFSRIATLIVTVIALIISLKIRSILEISWIASNIITTGAFVPLVAGFFKWRGTPLAALASMWLGCIFCTYNLLIALGVSLPSFWEPQSAEEVILGISLSTLLYIGCTIWERCRSRITSST